MFIVENDMDFFFPVVFVGLLKISDMYLHLQNRVILDAPSSFEPVISTMI